MPRGFVILLTSAALAFVATDASAHAQLVGAEPAADSAVDTPTTIALHFSEALEPAVSHLMLADAAGHSVAVTPADSTDGKSLAVTPEAPLAPGVYTVSWTAVGDDAHAVTGTLSFTVK